MAGYENYDLKDFGDMARERQKHGGEAVARCCDGAFQIYAETWEELYQALNSEGVGLEDVVIDVVQSIGEDPMYSLTA